MRRETYGLKNSRSRVRWLVDLPQQRLGLVAALGCLDAPQMDAGAVALGGLDRGDQILVAAEQGRVADGAVPGQ